jgi:hypothetical protein
VHSWFPKNDPAAVAEWWPEIFSKASGRVQRRKPQDGRQFTDFVAWKEALADAVAAVNGKKIAQVARTPAEQREAAKAVLAELQVYEPALNEFRATMHRPRSRYPVNYLRDDPFMILLPHLARIKSIAQELNLRACAGLAVDDMDGAFRDTLLGLRIAESLRDEMFIVSQLGRAACLDNALQPVWEGIALKKWSDAQLQAFQARLATIDLVSALDRSLRSERAAAIAFIEQARKRGNIAEMMDVVSGESPHWYSFPNLMARLMPRGWFDLEQVSYCKLIDDETRNALDVSGRTIDLAAFQQGGRRTEQLLGQGFFQQLWHHRFMARLLVPALNKAARRYAVAQAKADEALIACAIERYRLANGKLPETLEALIPKYVPRLPHDVLSGKPLSYRTSGDQFVLSSVGSTLAPSDDKKRFPVSDEPGKPGEWEWHSGQR